MEDENQPTPPANEEVSSVFRQLQSAIENTPVSLLTANIYKEQGLDPLTEPLTLREAVEDLHLLAVLGSKSALREFVFVGSLISNCLCKLPIADNIKDSIAGNEEDTKTYDADYLGPGTGEMGKATGKISSCISNVDQYFNDIVHRVLDVDIAPDEPEQILDKALQAIDATAQALEEDGRALKEAEPALERAKNEYRKLSRTSSKTRKAHTKFSRACRDVKQAHREVDQAKGRIDTILGKPRQVDGEVVSEMRQAWEGYTRSLSSVSKSQNRRAKARAKVAKSHEKFRFAISEVKHAHTDLLGACSDIAQTARKMVKLISKSGTEGGWKNLYQISNHSDFDYVNTGNKRADEFCNRLIQRRIDKAVGENVKRLASKSQTWPVLYPAISGLKNEWVDEYVKSLGLGSQLGIRLEHKTGYTAAHKSGAFNWYDLAIHLFAELDAVRTNNMAETHVEEWREAEDKGEGIKIDSTTNRPEYDDPSRPTEYITEYGMPIGEWNRNNIWRRKAKLLPKLSKDSIHAWLEACVAKLIADYGPDLLGFDWPQSVVDRAREKSSTVDTIVREQLALQLKKISV